MRLIASLNRILAIARNTLLESSRNRAFIGLGIASVAFIVTSIVISNLAVSDQKIRVLKDFGLFAIGLLENVVAIIMGVILVYKEIDRKTFYLVLSKPVRRAEVIIGKFVGLSIVLSISDIIMGFAWILSLYVGGGTIEWIMVKALILIWFEALLITSIALFFSSFATPVMSGVFAGGMFLLGRVLYILEEILYSRKTQFIKNPILIYLAKIAIFVLPDLSVFNISKEITVGIPVGWDYVLQAGLYSLAYCMVFIALGIIIFERKDFV